MMAKEKQKESSDNKESKPQHTNNSDGTVSKPGSPEQNHWR